MAHAAAPVHYTLTDLDWGFRPLAVNDAGVVAGFSLYSTGLGSVVAGKVDNAGLHALAAIDGNISRATAINGSGLAVGNSTVGPDAYNPIHAVIFKQGQTIDLGSQMGGTDYGMSQATGVNNQGQVAGTMGDFSWEQDTRHGFVYQQGVLTDIGSLGGGISFAYGINNHGAVTGGSTVLDTFYAPSHAFIYSNGQMTDLGTLGGASSIGMAINDAGQVVGYAGFVPGEPYPGLASHAFLWGQGQMKDLGTLEGDASSFGYSLNASGAAVGFSMTSSGSERAFLYQDGQMIDLNSYLIGSSHQLLARAYGISDTGVIVGIDRDGRGFMLTPGEGTGTVPEPEVPALALSGLMLAGLASSQKRRHQPQA